jgi:hypothetical protein
MMAVAFGGIRRRHWVEKVVVFQCLFSFSFFFLIFFFISFSTFMSIVFILK